MEPTSKSKSYSDLLVTLDNVIAEQEHRHLWLFLYSRRHSLLPLLLSPSLREKPKEEEDQLFDDAYKLFVKFAFDEFILSNFNSEKLTTPCNEFCMSLVYAFHRRNVPDGFIDPFFEDNLTEYDALINSLTSKEIAVVRKLHELTYKYGFLITELWMPIINTKELIDIFTSHYPETKKNIAFHNFKFVKKANHPKGIQISIGNFKSEIREPWDFVIFTNKNDTLSHVEIKVKSAWNIKGKQTIGDPNDHKIALYIDRNKCTASHALITLRLQIDHLNDYINGTLFIPTAEHIVNLKEAKALSRKEAIKKISSIIDRIRLSEGIVERRWSIEKNNVRRSIGIYLWDRINLTKDSKRSRKQLIKELAYELKDNTPKVLELYLGHFNKHNSENKSTIFGDLDKYFETVIREMEYDYSLTAHCIKNHEYLTLSDARGSAKRVNKKST